MRASKVFYNWLSGSQGVDPNFLTTYGDVLFDQQRVYGYNDDEIYAAGPIVIDLTGAVANTTVLIYHQDDTEPTFSGATVNMTGDYVDGQKHIIVLEYDGSEVNGGYHVQIA